MTAAVLLCPADHVQGDGLFHAACECTPEQALCGAPITPLDVPANFDAPLERMCRPCLAELELEMAGRLCPRCGG